MKQLLLFVSLLALASVNNLKAQNNEDKLQAELDRLSAEQNDSSENMTIATVTTTRDSHRPKPDVSRGRYGTPQGYAPLSVFKGRHPYTGPECLEGLGYKSAAELGWTGRLVYNQMLHKAEIVPLSASAMIYYDTATKQPIYIDGCMRNGKAYKNMIAFVEEQPAPPQPRHAEIHLRKAPVDCVIVRVHDCYGNVREVKMTHAQAEAYVASLQQPSGRFESYATNSFPPPRPYGYGGGPGGYNSHGSGNVFGGILNGITVAIGNQINSGNHYASAPHAPMQRPPGSHPRRG
ncbi:MAG TPA: hypothetical protein VFA52_03315 [Candidatus Paceibacterota bacterium]|nr:hypothetical protein [Candidatus Paceibacterota bacterium]